MTQFISVIKTIIRALFVRIELEMIEEVGRGDIARDNAVSSFQGVVSDAFFVGYYVSHSRETSAGGATVLYGKAPAAKPPSFL